LRRLIVLALLITAAPAAYAADPYRIGISAAVTGGPAGTYAPTVDAYNAYFKRINDAGGIHGHPIEIAIEDDRGEPERASAAARKLGESAIAVVVASTPAASTAVITQASKTPLLFGGGVCPRESLPPSQPLVFCSASSAVTWDSRFAVSWVQAQTPGTKLKLGFVTTNVSSLQAEMELAERLAKEQGLDTGPVVVVPAGAADLTPAASRLKTAGVDWVLAWAPAPVQVGLFQALKRIGWNGSALVYAHPSGQDDLTRLQAPTLYAFGGNAMFSENLPIHAEIRDATRGLSSHPPHAMADGWVSAMVLEDALRRCGWPCGKEKLAGALTLVSVDTKGLRGGTVEWTADNHFRRQTHYKVYRWDPAKRAVAPVGEWTTLDVK
jgi:ABC-type branched-subunit amino acid transport system substrate-binding protein